MKSKTPRFNRRVVQLALLGLFIFLWLPTLVAADSQTAADKLQQAWQLAQDSGRYSYRSLIDQTSYPAPLLTNAGKSPTQDKLAIEGWVDLPANKMELTLWQDGSFDPNSGMAIRVEGDQAYGRIGQDEWQEIDNVANLFAPGGDPLGFLAGVKNIQEGEIRNVSVGGYEEQLSQTVFEIDGPTFAIHMRQQMEKQLREQGRLPAGMQLSTSEMYRHMTGQGELWLDAAGLPNRLVVNLDILPQDGNGRIVATITSDYYDFDHERITGLGTGFFADPQAWITYRLPDAQTSQQIAVNTSLCLLVALVGMICIANWRSRKLYAAIALVVTASMLFAPLMQGQQAHAFFDEQQEQQAAQQAHHAEATALDEAQAAYAATDWNPNQDPLAVNNEQYLVNSLPLSSPELQTSVTIADTTDSDGDGLLDVDEAVWESCDNLDLVGANCEGVVDPSDSDADGFSDGLEVQALGTHPAVADSDHDGISDYLEITGFSYNGVNWYLNPNEADSNKDGILDGLECFIWTELDPAAYDPTAVCPDTDTNGTPDIFDDDNDGDGVADAQDLSPFSAGSQIYDGENPFRLAVDNLEQDKPVYVDIQFRPTDPTNLTLYNHVLDWPTGDTEGQIQRRGNSTWADTANIDIRSNAANAANGDIRLVPMLEITMPYADGHYANLPITPNAPATRGLGDSIDSWLDSDQLEPFAITVTGSDSADGTLTAYVPLSPVSNDTEGQVAFSARMFYRPSQGTAGRADWGAAQEFRVLWLVQMITDECINPEDDPATCIRQDTMKVIHTYEDEWTLTGLNISEEHRLDAAILYENPATDVDLQSDDQLWIASWNLTNTFLRGRDCDVIVGELCQSDGVRDVSFSNMVTEVPDWFPNGSYLNVETFSYEHEAYLAKMVSTEGTRILNDTFTPYAGNTTPTLLYAHEHENRQLNLNDFGGNTGNLTTFDFDPSTVTTVTRASLSWTPYQYAGGAWQAYEPQNYLDLLAVRLAGVFQPEDDSEAAQAIAEGQVIWSQLYYAALMQGLSSIIETDGLTIWAASVGVPETRYEPLFPPGATNGTSYIASSFAAPFTQPITSGMFKLLAKLPGLRALSGPANPITQDAKSFLLEKFGQFNLLTGVLITAAVVGATLAVVGYVSGNEALFRTGVIILAAVTIVVLTVQLIIAVNAITVAVVNAVIAGANAISAAFAAGKAFQGVGVIGFLIGALVTWGLLITQWQTKGLKGITLNVALSLAIATTIVLVVLLILDLVGLGVLVLLLTLIDAIFILFDAKGPTQLLIEALAEAIYDVDLLLNNLDSGSRLSVAMADLEMADERAGFSTANDLTFTFSVTNTLKYDKDFNLEPVMNRNVFRHYLQQTQTPYHNTLTQGEMSGEWLDIGHRQIRTAEVLSQTIALRDVGAGLNQNVPLYLTESFLTAYRGCWLDINSGCQWQDIRDSIHLDLGESLVFDILPETVTEFASMTWNANSSAISLPPQTDLDGDGLLSKAAGGSDPDDTDADTDDDGLSDKYELLNGSNPQDADSDDDGLDDAMEYRWFTDPNDFDSDGDNLNDKIETTAGWLVAYGDDSTVTRVWSNPLAPDADGDGLNDLEEFVYSLHPLVATDPSVINDLVQINNLRVDETDTPKLLLQFEDRTGTEAFADSSGNKQTASCTNCPAVTINGRYGQALSFDGVNDYVEAPFILDPAATQFTATAWFNVNNYNGTRRILHQLDGSGIGRAWLYVTGSGRITSFLGGSALTGSQVVTTGQWHHAAVTYDGVTLSLYLDGNLEASQASPLEASDGEMVVGVQKSLTQNWFNGSIDEVAIFDYALSGSEIDDVMNGRYNVNDRYLQPGAELSYEATITNTLATQGANGFMVAQTQQILPNIPQPVSMLHFENNERVQSFQSVMGNSSTFYCLDNGTCPTFAGGRYADSLDFDGVDDVVYMPTLNVREEQGIQEFWDDLTLSFWLKVETLPAPGEIMPIITTDVDAPGALNIYLNSDGWLIFDVQDTILKAHEIVLTPYGDPIELGNYYDGLIGSHAAHAMPAYTANSENFGGWMHYVFVYQQGANNAAHNVTFLFANGDGAPQFSFYSILYHEFQGANYDGLRLGPGTIGNSQESQTIPFDGSLDEVVIYNGTSVLTSDKLALTNIYRGYYSADIKPAFLAPFRQDNIDLDYRDDVRKASIVYCDTSDECPEIETDGQFGNAITFDGVDDSMWLGPMDFPRGDYTISGWFKTSDTNSQYLFSGLDPTNSDNSALFIGLTAQGRVRYKHYFPASGEGGLIVQSPTGYNDGVWHHFAAVRQDNVSTLYLDGVAVDTAAGSNRAEVTVNIRLGRLADAHAARYNGQLDELVIIPAALTSDSVSSLMNSRWPAIGIPDAFIPYHLDPQQELTVSGTAQVDSTTLSTAHRFEQEVEAAIEFAQPIQIPVVDDNAANLELYAPFEDVPGSTVIENIVGTNELICPIVDACPTAGLRGIVDRAALFDGEDDYLYTNTGEVLSYAFWVKADRGILFDTRLNVAETGLLFDFDQLAIQTNNGGAIATWWKEFPVEIPKNLWTHVAVVIDKANNDVYLYINGELAGTLSYFNNDPVLKNPTIGGNTKGGDYLNGYLDDFHAYNIMLTESDVQALYENSAPILRFEFDEEKTATSFMDASPNGFIAQPTFKPCNTVTVNTINFVNFPAPLQHFHVVLKSTGETIASVFNKSQAIYYPATSATFCDTDTIQFMAVASDGTVTNLYNINIEAVDAGSTRGGTNPHGPGGPEVNVNYSIGAEINYAPETIFGTDGKIGNTVLFPSAEPLTVNPDDDSALDLNDLTLMFWVKPEGARSNRQFLLIKGNSADNLERNYSLHFQPDTLQLRFAPNREDCTSWTSALDSNGELPANQWTHVAVTFDGNSANLYLNGVLNNSRTYNNVGLCQNDHPLRIGDDFLGEIDELAIYGRPLTAAELFSIYLRELRWYRANSTSYLTVDNDTPTAELLSDYPYRANGYIQLAVAAADPTSYVSLLEMGLKAPGEASFSWGSVTRCDDSRVAWCPYFDSSALAGEGIYEIQFRAVDAVGHESFSSIYQMIVDGTAPTASSSYSDDWLTAVDDPNADLTWIIPLNGTIDDPAIGGAAGSGVLAETAMISLVDSLGQVLGGAAQSLSIDVNSWSVDYAVVGERPYDTYTIQITAEDAVGNATTTTVGTVRLDERPPHADLNSWQLPTLAISQTTTLSGTVGEQANWSGEMALYHFEEGANSITFYDSSSNDNHSSCTNCPVTTVGLLGQALSFDGVNDYVEAPFILDPGETSFTAAAWIKLASINGNQQILHQDDGTGTGRYWLRVDSNGQLVTRLGGAPLVTTQAIMPGQWYHVAVTYDGTTLKLFVDGVVSASAEVTMESSDGAMFIGTSKNQQNWFNGAIDEMVMYDGALSTYEIAALAQKTMRGVGTVEVSLESFDPASGSAGSENWQPATVAHPGALLSTWSYVLPSVADGFYQIRLRSSDADGNSENGYVVWRGTIDTTPPQITFSGTHLGNGATAVTEYSFTMADFLLDNANFNHPCSSSDVIITTYTLLDDPRDGLPYQADAICQVPGHIVGPVSVSASDGVGLSTTETITLTLDGEFSDGTTSVTVLDSGDQTLRLTDHTDPALGILVEVIDSSGSTPAVIESCNGAGQHFFDQAGDSETITCGSVILDVEEGTIENIFFGDDGSEASVSLNSGNGLIFKPDRALFFAPETNNTEIVVEADGVQKSVAPGGEATSASLNTFVILGTEGVYLKQNSTVVSGHIGANLASDGPYLAGNAEMTIGNNVQFQSAESWLLGDNVKVNQNATVYDVFTNNEIVGKGNVLGQVHSNISFPLGPVFPEVPSFTPGSQDIVVSNNGSLTLDAGSYGLLDTGQNATVILTGGLYDFSAWDIGNNVTIIALAPVEIRIAGNLDTGQNGSLLPDSASGFTAKDIRIIVTGQDGSGGSPGAVEFGNNYTIIASVYVPNGTININQNSQATGAFLGRWVLVGNNAILTLDSGW